MNKLSKKRGTEQAHTLHKLVDVCSYTIDKFMLQKSFLAEQCKHSNLTCDI